MIETIVTITFLLIIAGLFLWAIAESLKEE